MTFRGLIGRAIGRVRGGAEGPALAAPHFDLESLGPAERATFATLSDADRSIVEKALPNTMTGVPRLISLIDSVRYCVDRGIPGAFAECGVWLGGSVMVMALVLRDMGVDDRSIHLFDTFEGMTAPTAHDTSAFSRPAVTLHEEAERQGGRSFPEFFDEGIFDESRVRENVVSTGYPPNLFHFAKGRVEETLPAQAPDQLALVRLDTDWYESTRHELVHLYPRLAPGGVLIIDDYGHWDGVKRAVDEYFSAQAEPLLLSRIDYAARVAVKH